MTPCDSFSKNEFFDLIIAKYVPFPKILDFNQFDDRQTGMEYELNGIIVHDGTTETGH